MAALNYVEDYIECIIGWRVNGWHTPIVTLARYDLSPLLSFSNQISNGVGFTDKQAQLALRLINTYKRQLMSHGIDVTDIVANPKYKFSIRKVDRSMVAAIDDVGVTLKFPFNATQVNTLREFADTSEGRVYFDRDNKLWRLALTEDCVNFAVAFASSAGFEIQPELATLAADIQAEEATPHAIELCLCNGNLTITNASAALLEYIDANGGLTDGNLKWLVDMSEKLGYTVSTDLSEKISHSRFAVPHTIRLIKKHDSLGDLVDYAREYNKFPILSYQNSQKTNEDINAYFDASEIVNVVRGSPVTPITEHTKVIHIFGNTYKPIPSTIPLLICYTNMMFGGLKTMLLQNADKVCYYCDTFY
ncbi:hypothetical protein UFOVP116_58 [uncultured Caudovirales phage]|uniref:Uncharacterized protein n=1 Tax=uncultured Caudovirales phage TaxID=2100421 RepID=A0A6J5L8P3_9CAUD|nr:hypothetical protein UFOVP116_58 [uncultured Caudovirales phage]